MSADKLRDLEPGGDFVTLGPVVPYGTFQARKARDGVVSFYWRYKVTVGGVQKTGREKIGRYDGKLSPKSLEPVGDRYSLEAARRAAQQLAVAHAGRREEGGILAIKADAKAAREQALEVAATDRSLTLAQLVADYADYLEQRGAPSVGQVRSALKCHIKTCPRIANKAARLVTLEDVADLMRPAIEAGKARAANKVRSHISAAYGVAKLARSDARIPASLKAYGITTNPAAEAAVAHEDTDGPREIRALTVPQLRAYWNVVRKVPGVRGAVLRFHLLTGGQRPEQLTKLRTRDDFGSFVIIYDGKGRSRTLRPHAVPLIPAAREALDEASSKGGAFALSSDGGLTHIHGTTFSKWASEVVAEAREAGDEDAKTLPADFSARLVRSGIETALAAHRIGKEIRGRLQSHGISGVQDRHYNAHDYLDEKRECVELIHKLLTARGAASKVVQLAARKG